MLLKIKSISKMQKSISNKSNDEKMQKIISAEQKNDLQIRKVSDRDIALSYILW